MQVPDIFYVEDNEDFCFLMDNVVKEVNDKINLFMLPNGKRAIEILLTYAEFKQQPRLILLDLNLPGLSGIDVLKRIKEIDFLKAVPVVFFSTSDNPKDKKTSIEFGAADFITKPSGYIDLVTCFRNINNKWIQNNITLN
jgi:DNA-binding response OmpR family regulator